MRIGELARATGESVRTLRYWADEVLLEMKRAPSGYREFPEGMVERVAFIRDAQALGLTLQEIRSVIELRKEGVQPCAHVRRQLQTHLASVRARRRRLEVLEDELAARLAWAQVHPEPECEDACVYLSRSVSAS
jgi:MerR family transcriptional regulator, copper efflux regulator